MSSNRNLINAKAVKNDEFYTRYEDIEKELNLYDDKLFYDKIILCPCDDYQWSNFTKYFKNNFERYHLKKLICTCYNDKAGDYHYYDLFTEEHGKLYIYDGKNEIIKDLDGNGDFRSPEITKYRDYADIIVTNPPFSLFGDFLPWVINKKFLFIASLITVGNVSVFKYFKNKKLFIGNNNIIKFITEDNKLKVFGNIGWFTNLITHNNKPNIVPNVNFNDHKYRHYDNYPDIIDVPELSLIPKDYDGIMGVPITLLTRHNYDDFDIIMACNGKDAALLDGKAQFLRLLIKRKKDEKR